MPTLGLLSGRTFGELKRIAFIVDLVGLWAALTFGFGALNVGISKIVIAFPAIFVCSSEPVDRPVSLPSPVYHGLGVLSTR